MFALVSKSIDTILTPFLNATGGALVIYAIFKSFKDLTSGRVADAIKRVALFAMVAAVLFQPDLLITFIDGMGSTVKILFNGITDVFKGEGTPKPVAD